MGAISVAASSSVAPAEASAEEPILVSRASGEDGPKANAASTDPTISADGRHVAFSSRATNLSPEDPDSTQDVYVRDLAAHTTSLVSRATGFDGRKGNLVSGEPSISADGQFVAFSSSSTNLEVAGAAGIFLRDLQAGTTYYLGRGGHPEISADGEHVAFVGADGIYVLDRTTGLIELVSRESGPEGEAIPGHTSEVSISGDGTKVGFQAKRFEPEIGQNRLRVLVRDRLEQTTTSVGRRSGMEGAEANGLVGSHAMSVDGETVVFVTNAQNLGGEEHPRARDAYSRDLETATTRLISSDLGLRKGQRLKRVSSPTISGLGERVAFAAAISRASEEKPVARLFLANARGGNVRKIRGVRGSAGFSYPRIRPAISGDGTTIALESDWPGMVPSDRDKNPDIYVVPAKSPG